MQKPKYFRDLEMTEECKQGDTVAVMIGGLSGKMIQKDPAKRPMLQIGDRHSWFSGGKERYLERAGGEDE